MGGNWACFIGLLTVFLGVLADLSHVGTRVLRLLAGVLKRNAGLHAEQTWNLPLYRRKWLTSL